MNIQITGIEQVAKRLHDAPSLLVAKAFAQALDQAGGVIAAEVEARTPEGEEGLLKESVIQVVDVNVEKRGGQINVGFSSTPSERTGAKQDDIAFWVEFGHNQKKKTGSGFTPAHPFIRPAFSASGDQAIEVFQNVLLDNLFVVGEPGGGES